MSVLTGSKLQKLISVGYYGHLVGITCAALAEGSLTRYTSKPFSGWVGTITGLDYWTGLLDWTTGLDYWTGLLDWTTGFTQTAKGWVQSLDWTTGLDYWTHPNCKIQLVECKTEAKRTYSLSYFANSAPYIVFPGVSRGQRSRAYLISIQQ